MDTKSLSGPNQRSEADASAPSISTLEVFKRACEGAPIAIGLFSGHGTLQWVNRQLVAMTGVAAEDLVGTPVPELIHHEDRESLTAFMGELIEGRLGKTHLEIRLLRTEGRHLWGSLHLAQVETAKGEAPLFQLLLEDITIRKRAARELETSHDRISALIGLSPAVLHTCMPMVNFPTSYVSHNVENVLGWKPQDFLESPSFWIDRIHPDDRDRVLAALDRIAARTTSPIEYRFQHGDGEWRWIRDDPRLVVGPDGEPLEIVGCWQDISLQRAYQEKIKCSELEARKLALVASRTHNAVIITDAKGNIEWVNEGFTRMTEWEPDEVIGKRPGDVLQGPESDLDEIVKMRGCVERGEAFTAELINYTKSRQPYWVSLHVQPIHDEHGELTNFIGIELDVTQRKEFEQQLHLANIEARRNTTLAERMAEQAERASRAKGDFLANMSHEIRTPMNGIIGMTSVLLETELSDEQRDSARTVQKCAEHLLTLINDILDFSKIEAGMMELEQIDFDLRTMVEDVMDVVSHAVREKGLDLACLVDPEVPSRLRGDPARLRQILINLLNNAIKFTDIGEVTINVSPTRQSDEEAIVRFEVRDSGIGIPQDRMHRLFKSFSQVDASTTRKYGGTGLGLAICKELTELMDGEIGVESTEGEGSTFWFTARLSLQSGEDPEVRSHPKMLEGCRVLVVEPAETNRRVIIGALSTWGMQPEAAESAERGLRLLTEAAADGQPFDVAVISEGLPDMDGPALGRRIRAEKSLAETAMILLTPMGRRGDAKAVEEIGFSGYLTKPIKPSQLMGCMVLVLERRASGVDGQSLVTRHTVAETRKSAARILLAEDNVVNQKVALKILGNLGYRAQACATGTEAIALLDQEPFDIVLTDIQMPEMDGFELTAAIREREDHVSRLPIIAMTANALQGDREKCLEAGMDDYVSKPVRPNELSEVIERWLKPPTDEAEFEITGKKS